MKINYNYPATIFGSIFAHNVQITGRKIKYKFTIFACELFKVKIKIVNNTRNTYIWGQNTSKYRSQIIVNGIKPGSTLK